MKIAILGCDGYIGWPLTLHLLNKGHKVCGLDNYSRRRRVKNMGSDSLTPIATVSDRNLYLSRQDNFMDEVAKIEMTDYWNLDSFIKEYKPDTIIHLAEQPSAAWSMNSHARAAVTQQENVVGTLNLLWAMKAHCPNAHLIKLGTMGEYGTPNCNIPEGKIPSKCMKGLIIGQHGILQNGKQDIVFDKAECPMSGLLFPRSPGSFYHLSKVHDTHNTKFACDNWRLRSTDIMQGIVFGLNECGDENLLTRFDYDECFGTVINRFCTQAICGHPLTIYGNGTQIRGFLPLKDSIQCLTIAIENPPERGEYRTFNQFEKTYHLRQLAQFVVIAGINCGLLPDIKHIENPRTELETHYYNPAHQKLFDLGYSPTLDIQGEIFKLMKTILPYKDRINKEVLMPKTTWR